MVRGVAAKAVKENAYHRRHSRAWVVRLGDGTEESRRRMLLALEELWPLTAEIAVPGGGRRSPTCWSRRPCRCPPRQ